MKILKYLKKEEKKELRNIAIVWCKGIGYSTKELAGMTGLSIYTIRKICANLQVRVIRKNELEESESN